jgi:hypothetical protein
VFSQRTLLGVLRISFPYLDQLSILLLSIILFVKMPPKKKSASSKASTNTPYVICPFFRKGIYPLNIPQDVLAVVLLEKRLQSPWNL